MSIKCIEIWEENLRQSNKGLETQEGSCLMETWTRRGEPRGEKKAVTETREGKYLTERKTDHSLGRDRQVEEDEDGLLLGEGFC